MMALFITLMCLGVLLIFAEKLAPKGAFGTLGVLCLLGGIGLSYYLFGWETAATITACTMAGLGVSFAFWMRYFPQSRVAQAYVAKGSVGIADRRYRDQLGKVGVASTALRPSGTVEIDGEPVDVISESGFIEAGTKVKVIEAGGNRLVVEAIDEDHQA